MNLLLDHIVHFVKRPEHIQKSFSELGFNTVKGGRHLNWGTYNSLCYFSNGCYLEWIGLDNEMVARNSDNPLIQQVLADANRGEGFSQLAFRTTNIKELACQLEEKGYTVIGPVDGSRRREDGSLLTWSMLFIKQESSECRLPFFIQWGESEELRMKQLQPLTKHQMGRAEIKSISFTVNDGRNISKQWKQLFDLSVVKYFQDTKWHTNCYQITIGGINVVFSEPIMKSPIYEKPFLCHIIGTGKDELQELFGGYYHLDT